jgi:hypothetical protein
MKVKNYNFSKMNKKNLPLSYLYFEKLNLEKATVLDKKLSSPLAGTSIIALSPFYKPISQMF